MVARVSIIGAMAENRVIGKDNLLIWHIPQDMKRFKNLTMGKPVIMGRKTFESILVQLGKPLPGRTNIVVSRKGFQSEGVEVYASLEAALEAAQHIEEEEIFILGGAQIYEQILPIADRLYLTQVHKSYEGDAYFPIFENSGWCLSEEDGHHGDPAFTFQTWVPNARMLDEE